MSGPDAYQLLPTDLLARATVRGNEYAWPIGDIPVVIEAARRANLVSIGGQLQFRLSDGGTCECYWVEVDTSKSIPAGMPWPERVERTAEVGARDFKALRNEVDFLAAGRKAFAKYLDAEAALGRDPRDAMCFVWYLERQNDAG